MKVAVTVFLEGEPDQLARSVQAVVQIAESHGGVATTEVQE